MELEVIVGTYDCTIKGLSFDVLVPEEKGLKKKYHEKNHTGCVKAVACGGRYLATGSTDETIKLYDLRKHTEIGTLLQHEGSITWLTFHKDTLLLSASEDGTISVWKCGGPWEHLHTLTGHKYAVTCVEVHPSGRLALSVGKDRTLRTWDLLTYHGVYRQRLAKAAELVRWSPIGDKYILSFERTVTVYDVESGRSVMTIDVDRHINCLQFVQDTAIAVGSDHPGIDLFSLSSGECITRLEGHTNRVKGLVLSPGGEFLFSASSDGYVKTWKITESLAESKCVSSVDTGSRLTCITVASPESLLRELKHTQADDVTVSSSESASVGHTKKHRSSKKRQRTDPAITSSSRTLLQESESLVSKQDSNKDSGDEDVSSKPRRVETVDLESDDTTVRNSSRTRVSERKREKLRRKLKAKDLHRVRKKSKFKNLEYT